MPVVRRTGGLADTVQDWDGDRGTGFVFGSATATELAASVHRALDVYGDARLMQALQRAGMEQVFSWARSARRYLEVYERALARRRDAGATLPGDASAAGQGH